MSSERYSDSTYRGLLATVIWFVLVAGTMVIRWEWFADMSPNEWGDFLAGAVAPVAFGWFILGYFQQGKELRLNTEALKLQQYALQNQVEETVRLVAETRWQAQAAADMVEIERAQFTAEQDQAKAQIQPSFRFGTSVTNAGRGSEMKFTNQGGAASHLAIESERPLNGALDIQPTYIERGGGGKIILPVITSFPAYLRVAYVDERGDPGAIFFECPKQGTLRRTQREF